MNDAVETSSDHDDVVSAVNDHAETDVVDDVIDDAVDVGEPNDEFDDASAPSSAISDDWANDSVATQGALPLAVHTGDAGVDAAVARLAALDGLPIEDHAELFTEVHRSLQNALVDLDRA